MAPFQDTTRPPTHMSVVMGELLIEPFVSWSTLHKTYLEDAAKTSLPKFRECLPSQHQPLCLAEFRSPNFEKRQLNFGNFLDEGGQLNECSVSECDALFGMQNFVVIERSQVLGVAFEFMIQAGLRFVCPSSR